MNLSAYRQPPEFQAAAHDAVTVKDWLFDQNDPGEKELHNVLDDSFGNHPDCLNELRNLKAKLGNVVNIPAQPYPRI